MSGKKKTIYTKYTIQIINSLLDNVHGFIGLTNVENEIEKLSVFKRLQGISQLGLTNRIFPCALHNRYIHSLGVMYIVDQMAIRLKFDDDERQLIRLAAMLHDIGHYPFSHDVEAAYKGTATSFGTLAMPEDKLQKFAKASFSQADKITSAHTDIEYFLNGNANKYHHEAIGGVVIRSSSKIKEIIKDNYIRENEKYSKQDESMVLENLINDICAIIVGDAQHTSVHFSKKFGIMVQILHSELDADRIDYLLRDSTFSGATYGSFDVGMLIQSLEVATESRTGTSIVGVNLKGICCAEQLLFNRYFAYTQVIYHKYTAVLGCALQNIVSWMIEDRKSKFSSDDIVDMAKKHESDSRFYAFTDASLINDINSIDNDKIPCPDTIYKLVKHLTNYKSLDLISEVICSGINSAELSNTIKASPLFFELDEILKNSGNISKVYQYREMPLTKHIPIADFEKMLEEGLSKLLITEKNSYLADRLQDGVAVIESGKEPYLLVDSERSMLHDIYRLRYCILRSYKL